MEVTFNADGSFVVRSYAGDDWKDCRDHVKSVLGLSDDKPVKFIDRAPEVDVDRLKRQRSASDIWARSVPIAGTLAETYLHSRGLSYDGGALRFYPGGCAMVAQITDAVAGDPIGLHRTFLDRDGKRVNKKMLGAAAGGVVRLSGDDEVAEGLAIAEGIETALAAPYRPVWACLSASIMSAFQVLAGVESLTILADHDDAGIKAANRCGERWHEAGREVVIVAPRDVGADFADISEAA